MKGFKLTFGITILMASLLVFMPLASILVYSLRLSPRALRDIYIVRECQKCFLRQV